MRGAVQLRGFEYPHVVSAAFGTHQVIDIPARRRGSP
jgi:hypothetical protein